MNPLRVCVSILHQNQNSCGTRAYSETIEERRVVRPYRMDKQRQMKKGGSFSSRVTVNIRSHARSLGLWTSTTTTTAGCIHVRETFEYGEHREHRGHNTPSCSAVFARVPSRYRVRNTVSVAFVDISNIPLTLLRRGACEVVSCAFPTHPFEPRVLPDI